jgi:hypothetical protein
MSSLNPNYRITIIQFTPPGVSGAGNHIVVEAPMPETFEFDVASSYATILPQGLTGGSIATAMAAFGVRLASPALTAQLWQGSSEIQLNLALEFHTENDPVADVQTPILNLNRLVLPSISSTTDMLQSPGPTLNMDQLGTIASGIKTSAANFINNIIGGASGTATPVPAALKSASTGANAGANAAVNTSNTQNPKLGTSQYWKTQIENQISIRVGNYMYFDSVVITEVRQTFMSKIDAITGLPHHATVNITFKPLFMLTVEDLATVFTSNSSPGQSAGPNNNTQATMSSTTALSLGPGESIVG